MNYIFFFSGMLIGTVVGILVTALFAIVPDEPPPLAKRPASTPPQKPLEALKACPCCGGKARLTQWTDTKNPFAAWVECTKCRLTIDTLHNPNPFISKAKAIAIWNRRVPS